MKPFLLSALCAVVALSLFTPSSQAQAPANNGAGAGTATNGGTGTGSGTGAGLGQRRRGGGEGMEERHAREIIKKYDKDGDHALNATELAAFFEALHQRVEERRAQQASTESPSTNPGMGLGAGKGKHAGGGPQEHAQKAIEKFDKNGDGKLEVGEVAAMLRAIRERVEQHRATPGTTATNTNT